jgi:hypothetical protein
MPDMTPPAVTDCRHGRSGRPPQRPSLPLPAGSSIKSWCVGMRRPSARPAPTSRKAPVQTRQPRALYRRIAKPVCCRRVCNLSPSAAAPGQRLVPPRSGACAINLAFGSSRPGQHLMLLLRRQWLKPFADHLRCPGLDESVSVNLFINPASVGPDAVRRDRGSLERLNQPVAIGTVRVPVPIKFLTAKFWRGG